MYRRQTPDRGAERTRSGHAFQFAPGAGGIIFVKFEFRAEEQYHQERNCTPEIYKEAVVPLDGTEMTDHDLSDHIHGILRSDSPSHRMASETGVLNQFQAHGDADALHEAITDTKCKAAEKQHCQTGVAEERRQYAANTVAAYADQQHVPQRDFPVHQDAGDDGEDYCAQIGYVVYKRNNAVRNIRKHICDVGQRGGAPFGAAGCRVRKYEDDNSDYRPSLCSFVHPIHLSFLRI